MKETSEHDRVQTPDADDESVREYGRQLAMDSLLEHAFSNLTAARAIELTPGRKGRIAWRFVVPLAAAASMAIVAGVWWFSQRQDEALGLRVAEVRGKVAIEKGRLKIEDGRKEQGGTGSGSGVLSPASGVTEASGHQVAKIGDGGNSEDAGSGHSPLGIRHSALKVGDVLRPGDGVEVGADGYVKLAYPDTTQVELQHDTRMRVTRGAGSERTAKRLALDVGKFVCSVVPQKRPFEIKTRHATARVMSTRFSLGVTEVESRLAVQEGKVEFCQGAKILQVSAGEAATASDGEMGIDGRFVAAGGTVTDYVLNGINCRTHVFASAGITTLTVMAGGSVEVYAWGGGGGGGYSGEGDYPNSFGLGGGGGAANGSVTMTPGVYVIVVGGGGVRQPYYRGNAGSPVPGGGGLAAATGGSGQGGGYSGIFRTSVAQANALLIAGGGGGAGFEDVGGGGGGASGASGRGRSPGSGGTQTTGGAGGRGVGSGSALQGGTSGTAGDSGGGGGGGGGYYGGGAGFNGDNPPGNSGGGGGSGYFNPKYVAFAVLTAGSGATPGDSGNPLRGSAGCGGDLNRPGSNGVVVVRYSIGGNSTGDYGK